jgi:hypothetical protein
VAEDEGDENGDPDGGAGGDDRADLARPSATASALSPVRSHSSLILDSYAVQLAKVAGAHVIATARADTKDRVQAHGADGVVDYTTGGVSAWVNAPVDALLNLAPIDPEQFTGLAALVRDGGIIVNTTVWMSAPSDEERGVRGIDLYVRSDATELAELSSRVGSRSWSCATT